MPPQMAFWRFSDLSARQTQGMEGYWHLGQPRRTSRGWTVILCGTRMDGARTIIVTLDTSGKITGVITFIAFLPVTNSNYLLMPDLYPAELAAPSTRLIDVAYAFGSVSLLNAVSWGSALACDKRGSPFRMTLQA